MAKTKHTDRILMNLTNAELILRARSYLDDYGNRISKSDGKAGRELAEHLNQLARRLEKLAQHLPAKAAKAIIPTYCTYRNWDEHGFKWECTKPYGHSGYCEMGIA